MTTSEDKRDYSPWEIFISHSARDENKEYTSFAGRTLEGLEVALADFKLLIDKNLPPASYWEPAIRCWLARCDGAVVLLDKKALEADWVKRECCILVQYRALHPNLVILPVLIDVKLEELEGTLFADLTLIQFLTSSHSVVEEIAKLLRGRFSGGRSGAPSAMSVWITNLAAQLPEDRHFLKGAATELDCTLVDTSTGPLVDLGDRKWLAARFLDVSVSELYNLSRAIGSMAGIIICPHRRGYLADCVSPVWVAEEQAYRLLPHPDRDKNKRLVLFPAKEPVSADCYIKRATCFADGSRVDIETVMGARCGAEPEESLKEFKESLKPWMGISQSTPRPDRLYFLIIPPGDVGVQEKAVEWVYQRNPLVTVLKIVHVDDVAGWKVLGESKSWQVVELGALEENVEIGALNWITDLKGKILGLPQR